MKAGIFKRRKEQDRFKYMLGGIVVKWFPEVYDYSEREMNRIISGAFKNPGFKTLIQTVIGIKIYVSKNVQSRTKILV